MTKKLRVSHMPQVPGKDYTVEVESLEEAKKIMDCLANYDLFLLDEGLRSDFSNMNFLEELDEDGEWVTWMDDETGIDDLDEYFEFMEEENKQLEDVE